MAGDEVTNELWRERQMSEADKLLLEAGYEEKTIDTIYETKYVKDENNIIRFWKPLRSVIKQDEDGRCMSISMQELKAIIKKCEELRLGGINMSGGSHDYVYEKIEYELCGQMKDTELNDLMKDIAELAHDLEWYDSCDIGEEDYLDTVRKFKNKWFKESRNDRLKHYIDGEISKLKSELYKLVGDN